MRLRAWIHFPLQSMIRTSMDGHGTRRARTKTDCSDTALNTSSISRDLVNSHVACAPRFVVIPRKTHTRRGNLELRCPNRSRVMSNVFCVTISTHSRVSRKARSDTCRPVKVCACARAEHGPSHGETETLRLCVIMCVSVCAICGRCVL